jgi:hypothetical protein
VEINFIEEVAKALDTLSVERLVLTTPLGSVRCKECDKKTYTYAQARFVVLRMHRKEQVYTEEYVCPALKGSLYHVSNIDKQITMAKAMYEWVVQSLERYKRFLDTIAVRAVRLGERPNLVVMGGRKGTAGYSKALRLQIIRALAFPLQGLRKPRTHRIRRGFRPGRRLPRRDSARFGLPRGEIMTKMLAWPNSKIYSPKDSAFRDGADDKLLRRRNRAREAESVRRDVSRETLEIDFERKYGIE